MAAVEMYLREIYYDSDSDVSYSNIKLLWNRVKSDHKGIKYQDLKKWLTEQYTLHKALRKSFRTRKTYVPNVDDQFQADIVDMQSFEKDNKGYRYILTVIDIFSRYGWAIAVKSKRGDDARDAFVTIFRRGSQRRFSSMKERNSTIAQLKSYRIKKEYNTSAHTQIKRLL